MRQPLWRVLKVRDQITQHRLADAIRGAAELRARSIVVIDADEGHKRMVVVRPARENGQAVAMCMDLCAGSTRLSAADVLQLFPVSPAEAEIAVELARGASLGEVALQRGVQLETVRGQVKSILRKIGAANQKQLAIMLGRLDFALSNSDALELQAS
jgi:DNA-binding CsgD family transcriptional regulator